MTIAPERPALGLFVGRQTPRLYDRVLGVLHPGHYSPRTVESYVRWIKRFIEFHGGRHPRELSEEDVNAFLTDLALRGRVSAATQNQALAGILFPYRHVLEQPLGRVEGIVRARRPKTVPVVMSRDETLLVLYLLNGVPRFGVPGSVWIGTPDHGGARAAREGHRLRPWRDRCSSR